MDSCHLFNFLFGPKKATTELSKCFSSVVSSNNNNNKKQKSHQTSVSGSEGKGVGIAGRKCKENEQLSCPHRKQTPPSPLKQLQMKLVNHFTGSSSASSATTSSSSTGVSAKRDIRATCDTKCGTYHATLVQSTDELEDDFVADEPSRFEVTIVENPLAIGEQQRREKEEEAFANLLKDEPPSRSVPSTDVRIVSRSDISKSSAVIDMNNNYVDQVNSAIIPTPTECKRVVLHDNSNQTAKDAQTSTILDSSEVFKIVADFGEARAKLRRISSVSTEESTKKDDYLRGATKAPAGEVCSDYDHSIRSQVVNHVDDVSDGSNAMDKRSAFVQSLVRSFESSHSRTIPGKGEDRDELVEVSPRRCSQFLSKRRQTVDNPLTAGYTKPVTLVKPLPPKTPPKTNKAKCLNLQLSLNKPLKIQQLFQDEKFLSRFFDELDPLDRCAAAQVCRLWRRVLYANRDYWKDLIGVIDCTQLRREHLVECIINTLQTAKLKQQQQQQQQQNHLKMTDLPMSLVVGQTNQAQMEQQESIAKRYSGDSFNEFDQDDVWRIQELCNRYAQSKRQQLTTLESSGGNSTQTDNQQTTCTTTTATTTSKSSSIPSQISSTLSSVSLSSLLTPLSESSRVDSIKEKLYTSLNERGFDAICLFGATDDDLEELVSKLPAGARARITLVRFNNCCLTNRGLELFIAAFSGSSSSSRLEELELSGCNEITNSFELKPLTNLKRLTITDCINIADGVAQKLAQILPQLDELTIQAYHLTDAFLEYLSTNTDTSRLRRLELPNCKELTNQSLITIAKHFLQLQVLSVSGSTKISDGGIEILAEQAHHLRSLDLSWCTRITDSSLECIACDLGDTLTDLVIDRNINISDVGLGYLATMSNLTLLHIRWCRRITDIGLETVIESVRSLRYLSLAGLHQITARSLLCLVDTDLLEVELTNCPAVNHDLLLFLSSRMPICNIIF